jgi:hypothetical protein
MQLAIEIFEAMPGCGMVALAGAARAEQSAEAGVAEAMTARASPRHQVRSMRSSSSNRELSTVRPPPGDH